MKTLKTKLLLILLTFVISFGFAQNVTISGYVKDIKTGENLIGAAVYNKKTQQGTTTNNYGFYSIKIKKGEKISLTASYIGYRDSQKTFIARKDTFINFMPVNANEIESVIITAEKNIHKKPNVSILKIPLNNIKQMPTISGDPDILKIFQLMPGVQQGQEGSSSLYVRGGTPDQNLYLIDDIPLYYVNHLGGLVSVFDDNAINSAELYKGGFPARYGGRLSSIVDLRMKDGNIKKYHGEIKTGIISSKIFIEGPVKQNKTSFMFSARRSNLDIVSRPLSSIGDNGFSAGYSFFDIYGKLRHKISDKNTLYLSTYIGRDRISIKDKGDVPKDPDPFELPDKNKYESYFYTKWGNQTTNFRWNHLFGNHLFGNLIFSYSNFYLNSEKEYIKKDSTLTVTEHAKGAYNSGIKDVITKFDFDYYPLNSHKIKFGINGIKHFFNPGISNFYEKKNTLQIDTTFGNKNSETYEANFYAEDEISIKNFFSCNIGIRATYFNNHFEYLLWQPRIALNFRLSDNLSVKTAYSVIEQNLHLLSGNGTGMPSDIWLPASEKLIPEKSDQYVFNSTYTFPKKKINITIEFYYKEMFNLIDFKENASYLKDNTDWVNIVEPKGYGRAYGAEFLIQKKYGNINGWISYTYSKSERKFENINKGKFYPSAYDRPHNFAFVLNYQFKKNITFSLNWVFMSGNLVTFPYSKFQIENLETKDYDNELTDTYNEFYKKNAVGYYYGSKNNFRLPPYHRLDINVLFMKKKKRGERTWQVGLYNAYFHKNIFFLYYKGIDLYKFTLFPIIPSVSYSFKF